MTEASVKQKAPQHKQRSLPGKPRGHKKPLGRGRRDAVHDRSVSDPHSPADDSKQDESPLDNSDLPSIKDLPKEVGVMLISAGILGVILPGPGIPAIIAGGLALWPNSFGKLEAWLERRYPEVHRQSMKQIGRFLRDLDKRYPYSNSE
jgi:hypothetical protein